MAAEDARILHPTWQRVGFGALLWVLLALGRDTALLVHSKGVIRTPIFTLEPEALRETLLSPGGPVSFAAAALLETYSHPWLGALALAVPALAVGLLLESYGRIVTGRVVPLIGYVPGVLALVSARFVLLQQELLLCLLLALAASLAYTRLAPRSVEMTALVLLTLGGLLSYLGALATPVFALLAACYEWSRSQRRAALVCLLAGEALPYAVGMRLLGAEPQVAFLAPLPSLWSTAGDPAAITIAGLQAAFPVLAALGLARSASRPSPHPTPRQSKRARNSWGQRFGALAPYLALLAIVLAGHQLHHRRIAQVSDRAWEGDWDGVLVLAGSAALRNRPDAFVSNLANYALAQRGELLERMFSYPQGATSLNVGDLSLMNEEFGLTPPQDNATRWFCQLGGLPLELGLLGSTEHFGHEFLSQYGPQPEVLEALIFVNALKGQPETAQVFCGALAQQPFHQHKARAWLTDLRSGDYRHWPHVQWLSSSIPQDDIAYYGMALEPRLQGVVERCPDNTLALDYLLAARLLTLSYKEIEDLLPAYRAQGHQQLPRHLREALILCEEETGREADLAGFEIPLEDRLRFADFRQAWSRASLGGSSPSADLALASKFGDTYWFYVATGTSGVG